MVRATQPSKVSTPLDAAGTAPALNFAECGVEPSHEPLTLMQEVQSLHYRVRLTDADFASGSGGTQLSGSGGPGFRFLTIIDTQQLSGKIIFVRREVGSVNSQFTLIVD